MAIPQQVTVLAAGVTPWYTNYTEWMTALNLDSANIATVLNSYAKADLSGVFGLFSTTLQMQNYVSAYVQGVAIAGVDVAQIGSANDVVSINDAGTGLVGIDLIPVGTVMQFAGASEPNGWKFCDGSAVSRTTYARLYAAIGTTYGVGDGSTTFNLPDTRGIFVKGAGTSTTHTTSNGTAYSGTLGGYENDMLFTHDHCAVSHYNSSSPTSFLVNLNGTDSSARWYGVTNPDIGCYDATTASGVGVPKTAYLNNVGTPRVGNRNQPANLALNYIIYTGVFA